VQRGVPTPAGPGVDPNPLIRYRMPGAAAWKRRHAEVRRPWLWAASTRTMTRTPANHRSRAPAECASSKSIVGRAPRGVPPHDRRQANANATAEAEVGLVAVRRRGGGDQRRRVRGSPK
jgi:hypothetical protein